MEGPVRARADAGDVRRAHARVPESHLAGAAEGWDGLVEYRDLVFLWHRTCTDPLSAEKRFDTRTNSLCFQGVSEQCPKNGLNALSVVATNTDKAAHVEPVI